MAGVLRGAFVFMDLVGGSLRCAHPPTDHPTRSMPTLSRSRALGALTVYGVAVAVGVGVAGVPVTVGVEVDSGVGVESPWQFPV